MANDLPTVVIEASAPSAAPRVIAALGDAGKTFDAWAQSKSAHPVDLPIDAAPKPLAIDAERAARILRIETALREARGPLELAEQSALPALRTRVGAAYQEARTHPEDPEAPFLVAESLRMLARIEELSGDTMGAAALRLRARLLDGGRKLGLSEGGEPAPFFEPQTPHDVKLDLLGAPRASTLFIDGAPRVAAEHQVIALEAGEHHLRLTLDADGATTFATWFSIGESEGLVSMRVGEGRIGCSADDLAPALAKLAAGGATFEVACPQWAIVRHDGKRLEIRMCGPHTCEPATSWLVPDKTPPPPVIPTTPGTSIFRSGWTYLVIGAAAVAVGGVAAWRLGAFDRPEAPPPTWRWEGVR